MGKITKENFKEFLGEASARITESERKLVAKFLKEANDADIYNKAIKRFKESKEDKREKAIRKSATKNKRYKGGLMVKPKAAKRGY